MPCDLPATAAQSAKRERDYRAENDQRTLMSAAEVVADRVRMKAAMALMKETRQGMDKMLEVLTGRRVGQTGRSGKAV